MNTKIKFGEMELDVTHKDIKNVHLSVHPPTGQVKISAPNHMNIDTVRVFALSKLSWIKKQQKKFLEQQRETKRDYLTRESHYYLGRRYLLRVVEHNSPPLIEFQHDNLVLYVRPNTTTEKRQAILQEWYRSKLKEIVATIIKQYEKRMDVQVNEFGIKKMKTKWGSCSIEAKRIWLNLELAKKPLEYIEYVVVHEMAHLLERRHNDKFKAHLDNYLPHWRQYRQELNNSQLAHVEWASE